MSFVLKLVRVVVRIHSLELVEQLRPRSRHDDGVRARLLEGLCCSYLYVILQLLTSGWLDVTLVHAFCAAQDVESCTIRAIPKRSS